MADAFPQQVQELPPFLMTADGSQRASFVVPLLLRVLETFGVLCCL